VFAQVFHAFVCKTRYVSMFTHGLFNNAMMNYAYVTGLASLHFLHGSRITV
jgi:hypothetical protein